jgi:hypothetical protein
MDTKGVNFQPSETGQFSTAVHSKAVHRFFNEQRRPEDVMPRAPAPR